MTKKHIKTELKRSPTKRQLSKWQRQQRIQRIIAIAGALFFVLIIGYIGYGYYDEQFKPLHEPVLKINDTVFDMDYYIKLLELHSQGKDATETSEIADELISVIEYGEIIRSASSELGFGVNTDEVNSELKRLGLPNDKVYRDTISSTLLANKLLQSYFDPKVPSACEQAQVQALFVESVEAANNVADKLSAGDDFSSLAEEYSLEAITKENGGDLGWLPKDFAYMFLGSLGDSLLTEIPFDIEPGVLSEPIYDGTVTKEIGYWLVEVTEKDEEKGNYARSILLGSRQNAEEIRARLVDGEDFGALAREYSQDLMSREQGGNLGWTQQQGEINNRVVLGLALQLEPGALSQPAADDSVQTKGGYWLVRVEDRDDNRVLEDDVRGMIEWKLLDNWVNGHRAENSVESYLTEQQKAWAVAQVLKDRG